MKIKFIILPLFAVFALAIPVQANEDLESCMQNEWCRNAYTEVRQKREPGWSPSASSSSQSYSDGIPTFFWWLVIMVIFAFLWIKRENRHPKKLLTEYDSPKESAADSSAPSDSILNLEELNGLMRAVITGNETMVKVELSSGADVNIADDDKRTALIWVARNGHAKIVKMLLAAGANPNAEDNDGRTALIWATRNGHAEIVKMLLVAKANPNVEDNYIRTALWYAKEYSFSEIVLILEEVEAK